MIIIIINGMANSVDPDQTSHLDIHCLEIICLGL